MNMPLSSSPLTKPSRMAAMKLLPWGQNSILTWLREPFVKYPDGPAGVPYTVTEGRVNLAVAFKNHEKELERRGFSVNIFKEYKYDYEKL